MTESASHQIESAQLRRSPRYGVFLALGAGLGILVALVLTFAAGGAKDTSSMTGVSYTTTQVFGFLCLFAIPIGMAVGASVALILDRMLARRAREVRVSHDRVHIDPSTGSGTGSGTGERSGTEAGSGTEEGSGTEAGGSGDVGDDRADARIESRDVAAKTVGDRDGQ